MSYQFEDDSALERLLNQQLERRPQTSLAASSKAQKQTLPTSQQQNQNELPLQTQLSSSTNLLQRPNAKSAPSSDLPRSFSAWLSSKNKTDRIKDSFSFETDEIVVKKRQASDEQSKVVDRINKDRFHQLQDEEDDQDEYKEDDDEYEGKGDENEKNRAEEEDGKINTTNLKKLAIECEALVCDLNYEQMSKARLVQLVCQELRPKVRKLTSGISNFVVDFVRSARRKKSLAVSEEEQKKQIEALRLRQEQEIKSLEFRLTNYNKLLEERLQGARQELNETRQLHAKQIETLAESFKNHLQTIEDNYKRQLVEAQQTRDQLLERQADFQKSELLSRFASCENLTKLDVAFDEWQLKLQQSVKAFQVAVEASESSLKKQTALFTSNSSGSLASVAHLQEFANQCQEQRAQISKQIDKQTNVTQSLCEASIECLKVAQDAQKQLDSLTQANDLLRNERAMVDELRNKLIDEQLSLAASKAKLDAQSVQFKHLEKKQYVLEKRHIRIKLEEANLRQQALEMHASRKKLSRELEKCAKLAASVKDARKSLGARSTQIEQKITLLNQLEQKVSLELAHAQKVQYSLVCSLCAANLNTQNELNTNLRLTNLLNKSKKDDKTLADETKLARKLLRNVESKVDLSNENFFLKSEI